MAEPEALEVIDINTTTARLHFRDILEEIGFNNKIYRVHVHGRYRACFVPPEIGKRAIRIATLPPVDPKKLLQVLVSIQAELAELEGMNTPTLVQVVDALMKDIYGE